MVKRYNEKNNKNQRKAMLWNILKYQQKPAIMQKMLSIYRTEAKSKAPNAVSQLKDTDKYIREHKDEFIKRYEKVIKATEKSGGKKIVLKIKKVIKKGSLSNSVGKGL